MRKIYSYHIDDTPLSRYCKPYGYGGFNAENLWTTPLILLSVLKKDGTWEDVFVNSLGGCLNPIIIEDLKLEYAEEEYARSVTGGLRYRLLKIEGIYPRGYPPYCSYKVKYFTRDYTPQVPKLRIPILSQNANANSIICTSQAEVESNGLVLDEIFKDVKVELSSLEGTTKMIVLQLDEGDVLPFQYEIEDYRKGYFYANVDTDFTTKLTVISYNKNGSRRSETVRIPPSSYTDNNIKAVYSEKDNGIIVTGIPGRVLDSQTLKYQLTMITPFSSKSTKGILDSNLLKLPILMGIGKNLMILNLERDGEKIASFKILYECKGIN